MTVTTEKYGVVPESGQMTQPVVIAWEHSELSDRTRNAFSRLSRKFEKDGHISSLVILDMTRCKFLSIGGLRYILEWHGRLQKKNTVLRIRGLSPAIKSLVQLARLDWILDK
jgi:anti-anti-sigma regulatory factor